jgi:hypothetical protein
VHVSSGNYSPNASNAGANRHIIAMCVNLNLNVKRLQLHPVTMNHACRVPKTRPPNLSSSQWSPGGYLRLVVKRSTQSEAGGSDDASEIAQQSKEWVHERSEDAKNSLNEAKENMEDLQHSVEEAQATFLNPKPYKVVEQWQFVMWQFVGFKKWQTHSSACLAAIVLIRTWHLVPDSVSQGT